MSEHHHRHSSKKKKLRPLILALRVPAFLLPGGLFALITLLLFPVNHGGFLYVGAVGCLLAGIGLACLCGLLDKFYPGLTVTGTLLLSGTLTIFGSMFMLYSPDILVLVEYQELIYYLAIWAFCLAPAAWYPCFRLAFHRYLKGKGFYRDRLKYKLKGARNYWFFETLRGSFEMPVIYWLNRLFLTLYLAAVGLQLLLGWWQLISGAVSFLLCLVLMMGAIMWGLFAFDHTSKYGKSTTPPVVLSLLGIAIPVAICIGLMILSIGFVDTMSFQYAL